MNLLKLTSLALLGLASTRALAQDLSANLGYNSEYVFRGIPQKSSSAFGGLDLSAGGFYLGAWGADVGDGLEIDYYGGYGLEAGDFGFSIGGTWYTYTGDFDDAYLEMNLGASWKWLSLDVALGEYGNFDGPSLDYTFCAVTVAHAGWYGKVGLFANDFDGNYYEAGYGGTLAIDEKPLLDYGIAVIYSDSTLLGGASDTHLIFTLSKTFDF